MTLLDIDNNKPFLIHFELTFQDNVVSNIDFLKIWRPNFFENNYKFSQS